MIILELLHWNDIEKNYKEGVERSCLTLDVRSRSSQHITGGDTVICSTWSCDNVEVHHKQHWLVMPLLIHER